MGLLLRSVTSFVPFPLHLHPSQVFSLCHPISPADSASLAYRQTTPRFPTPAGGCASKTWLTAWWTPLRMSTSSTSYSMRPCWSESLPRCKWPLQRSWHAAPHRPLCGVQETSLPKYGSTLTGCSRCGICGSRGLFPLQGKEEKHLSPIHAVHGPGDGNPLLSGEGKAEWGCLQLLLCGPALHSPGRDTHRPLVREGSGGDQ